MAAAELSRRSVARGALLAVAAGASGFAVARRSDAAKAVAPTAADPYGAPAAANAYGAAPARTKGVALAPLDKVAPGGGLVLGKRGVVLTRDTAGKVRGFSALCTHQGCSVTSVAAGAITCPCHGSRFNATTGAVVAGPATRGLRPVPVAVRDGTVFAT